MRRRSLIAGVTAAGAALAAGLYRFTDLFVKHYPPTPYDDVLAALVDREEAAKLGRLMPDAPPPAVLAAQLRTAIKPNGFAGAIESDIAADRLAEVKGWVVPQSVAWLSALAAKV